MAQLWCRHTWDTVTNCYIATTTGRHYEKSDILDIYQTISQLIKINGSISRRLEKILVSVGGAVTACMTAVTACECRRSCGSCVTLQMSALN